LGWSAQKSLANLGFRVEFPKLGAILLS